MQSPAMLFLRQFYILYILYTFIKNKKSGGLHNRAKVQSESGAPENAKPGSGAPNRAEGG